MVRYGSAAHTSSPQAHRVHSADDDTETVCLSKSGRMQDQGCIQGCIEGVSNVVQTSIKALFATRHRADCTTNRGRARTCVVFASCFGVPPARTTVRDDSTALWRASEHFPDALIDPQLSLACPPRHRHRQHTPRLRGLDTIVVTQHASTALCGAL